MFVDHTFFAPASLPPRISLLARTDAHLCFWRPSEQLRALCPGGSGQSPLTIARCSPSVGAGSGRFFSRAEMQLGIHPLIKRY
eukprot:5805496-Prymnesium_polylepis.1